MELSAFLQTEHIPYEENISLRKRTWIHRGGNARYYIVPETIEQLRELVTYLYKEQIEFKLVGHTSNLYIRNSTDIDIVISTIQKLFAVLTGQQLTEGNEDAEDEEAKKNDVPFYKDDSLAETLSKLEIGDAIPPELYEVVAEILVFVDGVDKLKSKMGR